MFGSIIVELNLISIVMQPLVAGSITQNFLVKKSSNKKFTNEFRIKFSNEYTLETRLTVYVVQ